MIGVGRPIGGALTPTSKVEPNRKNSVEFFEKNSLLEGPLKVWCLL